MAAHSKMVQNGEMLSSSNTAGKRKRDNSERLMDDDLRANKRKEVERGHYGDRDTTMPPAYTTAQKSAIAQLQGITQADKTAAARLLKNSNWNVERAANEFFSNGVALGPSPNKGSLSKLFDKYRDDPKNEPEEINIDGTMSMLQEMDVSPEEVDVLIFSELVQSPSLGKITRGGFVDSLSAQNVNDLSKLKALIDQRHGLLAQPSFRPTFKNIYRHTFIIARQQGQKSLALDVAEIYWRLLFTTPSIEWSTPNTPFLDWWLEFLQAKWKRAVNKDLWDQTLTFAEKCLEDGTLSWWNEDAAWPGVIDEFVEYVQKEKRGGQQGAGGDDMDLE